jgi:hypothetical protein
MKLANIILLNRIEFLTFLPVFVNYWRRVYFQGQSSRMKLWLSQMCVNILFSNCKFVFWRVLFHFAPKKHALTSRGFRENPDLVTRVPQIRMWGLLIYCTDSTNNDNTVYVHYICIYLYNKKRNVRWIMNRYYGIKITVFYVNVNVAEKPTA